MNTWDLIVVDVVRLGHDTLPVRHLPRHRARIATPTPAPPPPRSRAPHRHAAVETRMVLAHPQNAPSIVSYMQ
jgi:hypothetical protein